MCALPTIKRERRRRRRRMYMHAAGARARSNATAIVCKCGPWVRSGPDVSTWIGGTRAPPRPGTSRLVACLCARARRVIPTMPTVQTREGTSSCARPGNRLCVTQLIGGSRMEKPRLPLASLIFSSRFSPAESPRISLLSEGAKLSNRIPLMNAMARHNK